MPRTGVWPASRALGLDSASGMCAGRDGAVERVQREDEVAHENRSDAASTMVYQVTKWLICIAEWTHGLTNVSEHTTTSRISLGT